MAALAALTSALALPSAAAAAPTWLAPQTISRPGEDGDVPRVAGSPQGDAIAIWKRDEGFLHESFEAALRPAGGSFGAPQALTGEGSFTGAADIAVDPHGNAVAVWRGASQRIEAAFRPAGGSFGPAQAISPQGQPSNSPQVAIDAQGKAVVVWQRFDGAKYRVEAAFRPPGGPFGPPQEITDPAFDAGEAQVAASPQGDVIVMWRREVGIGDHRIEAAFGSSASEKFGPPQQLTGAGQVGLSPQVVFDRHGNAIAAWVRQAGGKQIVESAFRPAGHGFGPAQTISEQATTAQQLRLAGDPQGNVIAAWRRNGGFLEFHVEAAFRPAGGAFGPAERLSGEGNINEPRATIDPQGNAIIVWSRFAGAANRMEAVYRPVGGPFGPAQTIAPLDQNAVEPDVASDGRGNAIAVWRNLATPDRQIEAAGFDAAGPQLRNLSIPATAERGKPASFSVSPFDVWSQVASTSWSFGDGASAQGEAVRHAFAKVGTYHVTVTSTDAVGNSSTATGTVRVRDTIKPRISKLRVTPSVVRPAGKGARGSAAPKGKRAKAPKAKIRFRLSEPARVTFTVKRQVRKRCGKRRCLKLVRVKGKLTAKGRRGQNAVPFKGRVGGRALAPGRYVLTAQAKDPAGRKSKPAKVAFRVIR